MELKSINTDCGGELVEMPSGQKIHILIYFSVVKPWTKNSAKTFSIGKSGSGVEIYVITRDA